MERSRSKDLGRSPFRSSSATSTGVATRHAWWRSHADIEEARDFASSSVDRARGDLRSSGVALGLVPGLDVLVHPFALRGEASGRVGSSASLGGDLVAASP